jgi:hypothetical protein
MNEQNRSPPIALENLALSLVAALFKPLRRCCAGRGDRAADNAPLMPDVLSISYLPRGETVDAFQWEFVPGSPRQGCAL